MEPNANNRTAESWIDADLDRLRRDALFRELPNPADAGSIVLHFASNDYLNLSRHPFVLESAREALATYGAGAGASRLVSGNLPLHGELERKLADHKGYPAALVYGAGFLANIGIVPALVGRKDMVFADRLVHASLIDAIRLSGARLERFRHNEAAHLAERLASAPPGGRRLVITESVFSMDGDLAPLNDLVEAARAQNALMLVDEAHAFGVFGPRGAGRVAQLALQPSVHLSMGTLSKAVGSFGGFVACSDRMRHWLVNTSRSFIFSTALPPASAGAALGALKALEAEPDRGADLLRRAALLRDRLREGGLNTLQSESQIVPVLVGDNDRTVRIGRRLRERGVRVGVIRPPTVPPGTARLRLSVTLAHSEDDLRRAAALVLAAFREEGAE